MPFSTQKRKHTVYPDSVLYFCNSSTFYTSSHSLSTQGLKEVKHLFLRLTAILRKQKENARERVLQTLADTVTVNS